MREILVRKSLVDRPTVMVPDEPVYNAKAASPVPTPRESTHDVRTDDDETMAHETSDSQRYYTVARREDLADGQGIPVQVPGHAIALFREGEAYFAIDDACPHKGIPLSDGILENGTVTCTWHGWTMCLRSGRYLANPAIGIPTYPVRLVGEEIQVGIPENPETPANLS